MNEKYLIWKVEDCNKYFSDCIDYFNHNNTLPEIITYYSTNDSFPEIVYIINEYYLMSSKISSIIKSLNIPGIKFYKSELQKLDGTKLNDYVTVDLNNRLCCFNNKKSKFKDTGYYLEFKKIVLDQNKIPKNLTIFVLEYVNLLIIHNSIKNILVDSGINDLNFMPIDQFSGI